MTDLEHRIQWLEDRWAINDLLVRYSTTIDDHDVDGLTSLYAEDAVFDSVFGPVQGRAAIGEYYEERLASFGATYHIPYSQRAERISDTEARGEVLAAAELAIDGQAFFVALRYDDDYVKDNEGNWLFRERRIQQLYAMPLAELPEGLASDLRKRWPGTEPTAADLPEGTAAWQAHQARVKGGD